MHFPVLLKDANYIGRPMKVCIAEIITDANSAA
uniref:Uncharacterized protein n=1 Tax=Arundo donax TaxID=35708 RepID=A0A0A9DTR1_ARUDO